MANDLPSVSVILPVLNEQAFIRDCLESLSRQDYPNVSEVLVLDGGSIDRTGQIVTSLGGKFKLTDNPDVTAAGGLNIGIEKSVGEIIVRADAHTIYRHDYISRCVAVLQETSAQNAGGSMRPVGSTNFGRAVAAVTTSKFGVGPGKFHFVNERTEADTVYLGTWRKSTLKELGGFDAKRLQWGAEDHELNLRLKKAGGKIILDPDIVSWYFPRETPRSLSKQYRNYGIGKVSTLAKNKTLPSWRPLAPALLVLGTLLGVILAPGWWKLALPITHVVACLTAAVKISKDPGVAVHRYFIAILICHWSYGIGFWQGVIRVLTRRNFVSRPKGHR